MATGSSVALELQALLDAKKVVPAATLLWLLQRAFAAYPAPFLLPDFPRSASQLAQLEASVGPLALFLELPEASDNKTGQAMLRRVRESGRVHLLSGSGPEGVAEVIQLLS